MQNLTSFLENIIAVSLNFIILIYLLWELFTNFKSFFNSKAIIHKWFRPKVVDNFKLSSYKKLFKDYTILTTAKFNRFLENIITDSINFMAIHLLWKLLVSIQTEHYKYIQIHLTIRHFTSLNIMLNAEKFNKFLDNIITGSLNFMESIQAIFIIETLHLKKYTTS